MPKATRTPEEIQELKDRILSAATGLIADVGFHTMTMRGLAKKLGMTAANIYNYFRDKDELYLAIQTAGFNKMFTRFSDVCTDIKDPREKLYAIIKEYIAFGTGNPRIYDIIFSMDTPKYEDYKNTDIEPAAFHEKQAGLRVIEYVIAIVNEFIGDRSFPGDYARFKTIQVWIQLHGIVSLMNSRVLQEVEEDTDSVITWIINEFIENFEDRS